MRPSTGAFPPCAVASVFFEPRRLKRHKGMFKVKKRNGKTVESSEKAAPSATFREFTWPDGGRYAGEWQGEKMHGKEWTRQQSGATPATPA